jgi:hypothetical protein
MLIKEYEYIVLKLVRCSKKLYLPFVCRIYKELENQDASYVYRLRKKGYKVRVRQGVYQILLASRKVSLKAKNISWIVMGKNIN